MTLVEQVARALEVAGARTPQRLARHLVAMVREHDDRIGAGIRHRPPPVADCPDGCPVGQAWQARALRAEHRRDAP